MKLLLSLCIFILLFVNIASAGPTVTIPTIPNWMSVAVGVGHITNFHDNDTVNSPFWGGRVGYIQSKHLKFEMEGRYIFEKEAYAKSNYSQFTVAGYIVF